MAQAHGHMTAAQANAETSFPGPVRLASEGYVFER
jgi:hypothetical protein